MFQDITPLVDFFLAHSAKTYQRGDIILDYDAHAPSIFYIRAGYVRAYSIAPSGREKIYVFYQPNDMFPIVWTFNNINKQMLYEAMDDVVVYSVSREEFMQYIKDKPDILFDIIHRIVDRHSFYVDRVDNLCHPNGHKRVIKLLLSLSKRFGKKVENGILIQLPLTHADIANSIAMTRETASREMKLLQKRGLVSKYNALILLHDTSHLEEELLQQKSR